ncbi:WD40 repeat domain-containing serine/threonine protein kinase [Paludisphaera soli]|uniref:WD40 repeat domain-containing serine/threonine protein kinase n=1 Tax=Paludisphaera soli TaxID=2712865 RepID=UPI0013EA9190|nr:serine/threonine-protein kinase [Paludisphaera soli]
MAETSEAGDPLGELADEFLDRLRRGESPRVDAYLGRIPEGRRGELRDLLSALVAVEDFKAEFAEDEGGRPTLGDDGGEVLDRLGDYRILREVGRGGMGIVYEAEQESLGRRVALKVLAPWLRPGGRQLQRFLREARSAAQLHHPDIVPIFGVGEHEGRHFYAMQFIPGQGLDQVLDDVRRLRSPAPADPSADGVTRVAPDSVAGGRGDSIGSTVIHGEPSRSATPGRGDVTPSDAPETPYRRSVAEIVLKVAEALQHAHDRGMLHRDIKPSNLLLDEGGKVWVTDFGLVKAADGEDLTGTDDLVGTLRYMAPERFRGRCDARSDVYSLGLTLYEMLALRPAFDAGDRHRLIHQITQEQPEPIRRLAPTLPRDLATIVHTAIAPDPDERYATASALAEDLRRWLRHEPIRARRSPAPERLAKWARRNPAVAALAASAALAALAAVTILAAGYIQVSRTLHDSQRLEYFQRIALAERAWSGNDVGRAEALLDEAAPAFRSWEWRHLKRRCHAALATLRANGGEQPNTLAFAPDGGTAATSGAHGDLLIWDVPSGRRRRVIHGPPEAVSGLAFSPEGSAIASAAGQRTVRVHEVATGRELLSIPLPRGREALGVAYSPDGGTLAACAGVFWETVERADEEGSLTLWDAASGRPLRDLRGHAGSVHQAAFAPDGTQLASAGGDGLVKIWDPATGGLLRDLSGHEGVVMGVAYAPDGRRLVSAGLDGTLRLWDPRTGAAVATFREPGERFLAVAWSPDGRRIAAAGRSWSLTVWDAETGFKAETYRGHDREALGAAYSPDGRMLGSAGYDGLVRIWDAGRGQEARTLSGFGGAVTRLAMDPAGRWLAAASESGPIRLRDPSNAADGPTLDSTARAHGSAAFAPGGDRLAAGSRGAPGLVEVWDPSTGARLHALDAGPAAVSAVAFRPDGRTLAAGALDGSVRLWDAATGSPLPGPRLVATGPITALAFSPDGRRLAASTGDQKRIHLPGTVTIWDLEAAARPLTLTGHARGVADVAWSPDGLSLATAGWDQTVAVWDATTGGRRHSSASRGLLVWAVAFTPDGERVVAADNIGRLTFWDVATGHEVLTLPAHADRIYDLAFSADGRLLASAGRDATVKLWDADAPTAPSP